MRRNSIEAKQGSAAPFWESGLSRRRFFRMAAGATGVALGSRLLLPATARADDDDADPRPIPGGITVRIGDEAFFIHHFPPVSGNEPSNITDFNGFVGNSRIFGAGTGLNTETGEATRLLFQADVGFNEGIYVGEDGRLHRGTFAFL